MIRLKNLIDKEPFEFRRLSRSAFYNLIRKNIERGLVRSALNNLEVDLSISPILQTKELRKTDGIYFQDFQIDTTGLLIPELPPLINPREGEDLWSMVKSSKIDWLFQPTASTVL